ncbi:hypothetical protein GW17_00014297 [Ensete ventricosum]|nr:hypothetical protein GW17_00014297 [Ensete ventricosum]
MVLGLEVALGMARDTGWATAVVAGEEAAAVAEAEAGACSMTSVLGWDSVTGLGTGLASTRAMEADAEAEAEATNPGPAFV